MHACRSTLEDPTDDHRIAAAIATNTDCIGDIQVQGHAPREAIGAYTRALHVREELQAVQPANDEIRRACGVSHSKLAVVYLRTQPADPAMALNHCRRALAIAETLSHANPADLALMEDVRSDRVNLAGALAVGGMFAEARDQLHAALQIDHTLRAATPDSVSLQRDHAVTYQKIGDVESGLGNLVAAAQAHERALELREDLARHSPESAIYSRDVAVSCTKLGDVYLGLGDAAKALDFYLRDLSLSERRRASSPSSAEAARDLIVSLHKLFRYFATVGRTREAQQCFARLRSELQTMVRSGVHVDPAMLQLLSNRS